LSLQGKGKRMTKRDSECMKNKQNRMKWKRQKSCWEAKLLLYFSEIWLHNQ
jgi:hypothetical protein